MAAIETTCTQMCKRISDLENNVSLKDAEINKLERFSRRNNIRIVGIPTSPNENCEDLLFTKVFPHFKEAPELAIERCHREGRGTGSHPPHILVRFLSYKMKTYIMRNRRAALQGQSFFIVDDLTKLDLQEKKKWTPKVTELYERDIKLRFSGGKWRDSSGKPYSF